MVRSTKIEIETENSEDVREEAAPEEADVDAEIEVEMGDDPEGVEAKRDDPIEELEKKAEASAQEAKEAYDRFLRVSAEFENYKKRYQREKEDFRKFANESLLKAILPIVDNLELALNSSCGDENSVEQFHEGIDLTLKEMLKVFEKFGVKQIDSLNEAFDPTYHQAVMQEETEDCPGNTVVKELQRGYMIHDRLLRPSMVVVSKSKE